jgi:hypothetical protein
MKTLSPSAQYRTAERLLRTVHFRPYRKGMGPTFTLKTWDTYERDHMGKNVLAYQLTMRTPDGKRVVLFDGADFSCAPSHAIDGNGCVESLMGFLTLRPGDTDDEYFANYTPEQKEYAEQYAESLSCEVQNRFCDEDGNCINP